MIITVLVISIFFQLTAAIAALRLIKLTRRLWAWLLISSALLLMVIRRSLTLYLHLVKPENTVFSLETELVALITSLLLLVGIYLFHPILLAFRRESENIYEQLINAAPDTYAFLLDIKGEMLAVNKQGKIWLMEKGDSPGKDLPNSLEMRIAKILNCPLEDLLELLKTEKRSWHNELNFDEKWFSVSLTPLLNRMGEVDKFALFVNDISSIKLAHEKDIEHEQNLMQADKLASLGMMISGIAHEINNPNQFILSHIRSIEKFARSSLPILDRYHEEYGAFRMGGLPYQQARSVMPQMLTEIRQGSERIQRILAELRSFTLKNKRQNHRQIILGNVVESALVILRSLIKKATKEFIISVEEGVPAINGDFQQLEQVVINLVTNACQALTSPQESILLSVTFDDKNVYLIVDDSGKGIPGKNLTHITDPFFTTKKDEGGTGLGLAVTKRIVEEHGGKIDFDSRPDAGTRVTISFPWEQNNDKR